MEMVNSIEMEFLKPPAMIIVALKLFLMKISVLPLLLFFRLFAALKRSANQTFCISHLRKLKKHNSRKLLSNTTLENFSTKASLILKPNSKSGETKALSLILKRSLNSDL
jgi:hypothetical protein